MSTTANTFDLVPISDFCETGSGGTPSRSEASRYFGGSIPWVKSGELREGIITTTNETITDLGLKESAAKLLPKNTLLVALYGATVGRIGILGIEAATNQAVCHIIPDARRANRTYLFYALRVQVPYWLSQRVGVGQPNISQGVIRDTKIPLPPLPEQKRIADILDKADAIRRKRREAVAHSDYFLPSLFSHMFGPAGSKYEPEPLNKHLEFLTSGSRGWAEHYVKNGKRFIRSLDVQMNRIGSDDIVFVNPPVGTEAERTRVRDGDVLVTITGSRIGRVAFVPKFFGEAYVSQHVAIARLKPTLMPRFCSMYLSLSDGGQRQIAKAQYGQTKPGLSLTNIREFRVPIPPTKEQDRFLEMWDQQDLVVSRQSKSSMETDMLFNSLVQRAFRGEL